MADTLLDRRRPDGRLGLDELRLDDDGAVGHREGLHRGLRQQLPRRHGGQVRHRALDPAAHRGRHRQRVPLPRPGARPPDPRRGGQPVRRDPRHPPGPARGRGAGGPRSWWSPTWSTRRWPARPTASSTPGPAPRWGWPPPSATWPRSWPSSSWPSTWPSCGAPGRRPRSRRSSTGCTSLPGKVAEALTRAKEVDAVAEAVAGARDFFFLGPRRRLPGGPGGGPQAEGDLLPAGRGLPGRRAQARADRPHRAGHGGGGGGHPDPAAGEDAGQHGRGEEPRGHRGPGGRRRRRGGGGRWPTTCCGSRRPSRCSPRWSTWSPSSSSPTGWPACWATTSTGPATWPRR